MKNLIVVLFLAIGFYLISCHTLTYQDYGIDERLWLFANDIIENPEKIKDLKNYYPDLYDDNYIGDILSETAKDTFYINNLILYIKNDFTKRKYSAEIEGVLYQPYIVDKYKKHIKYQGLKKSELFGFCIVKHGKGIRFDFIKLDMKYYILRITKYTLYYGNAPMYDD